MHGVCYIQFIGDGDSSVHSTLIQNVPGWGFAISKMECANHACKCYRGALEQLVKSNPSYKGSGGLTVKMRKRLVSAARCAIRMRSREPDTKTALASLKKDLANGPRHCFGIHTQCNPDFCTAARDMLQQSSSSESERGSHACAEDDVGTDCAEERAGTEGCAGAEDRLEDRAGVEEDESSIEGRLHM